MCNSRFKKSGVNNLLEEWGSSCASKWPPQTVVTIGSRRLGTHFQLVVMIIIVGGNRDHNDN